MERNAGKYEMRVDVDGHRNPPSCKGQAARIGNLVQDSPGEFAQAAAGALRPVALSLLCRFLNCAGIACVDRILDPFGSGKYSFLPWNPPGARRVDA